MKIAHIADIQVKNREKNLERPYSDSLQEIYDKINADNDIEILVIAGDLFEYAEPNESERAMIYTFLSRLPEIEHLHEIVLIPGNHDLVKFGKSQTVNESLTEDLNIKSTPLDLFNDIIKTLNPDYAKKYIYIDHTGIYESNILSRLIYVGYSLEDGMKFDFDESILDNDDRLKICVFHGMLKDYVETKKIPLRKDILERLTSLENFPQRSHVLAGDIHQILSFDDPVRDIYFWYSGSTQQHTHSEGWYLYTDNQSKNSITDERKAILTYEYECYHLQKPEKIYLSNWVSYVTVNTSIEQNGAEIIEALNNMDWAKYAGVDVTYVLVRTKNKLSKIERKIYEIIKTHIPNAVISFDYGKITMDINTVESSVVKDILDEKTEVVESENEEQHQFDFNDIDNLVLSDEQLQKMFNYVIQQQLTKVEAENTEKIHGALMDLFKTQLSDVVTKSKHYSIELQQVYCSQFMALGKNNIKLDIKGITRILGTNGIGKTTLFRMIRWAFTGEVFEGMKSNTSVRNNMGIFNERLDDDSLTVALAILNNNIPVVIRRTATRKWKNNTTYEQKHSKGWQDFVSTIQMDLQFIINPNTENQKIITGENAQKNINIWLGDAINKLMFINQMKIEEILKSEKVNMNDTILDFIGCDYLNSLENNLDEVKNELMTIPRPKRDRMQILTDVSKEQAAIKECEQNIEGNNKEISDTEQKRSKKTEERNSTNTELINLGNVENQISENDQEIKKVQELVDSYKPQEPKELIQPSITKPEYPQSTIYELEQKLKTQEQRQQESNDKIIGIRTQIVTNIQTQITKERDNIKLAAYNVLQIETAVTDYATEIKTFISEVRIKLQGKISEQDRIITEYRKTISENKTSITNGVCPKCGRPFSDDYETHKQTLEAEISKYEELIKNEEAIKSTYFNHLNELPKFVSFDGITHEQIEVMQTNRFIHPKFGDILSKYKTLTADYNTHKQNQMQAESQVTILDEILSLINVKINASEQLPNEYKEVTINDFGYNDAITECKFIIDDVQKTTKEISDIKESYNKKLQEYTNHIEAVEAENKEIREYNSSIESAKNAHEQNVLKLNNLLIRKQLLDSQLPTYEKLKHDLDVADRNIKDFTDYIQTLTNNNTQLSVDRTRHENNILNLEKEKSDYDKYQENNIIWKIYSKVIKDNFKDIVFEYYRTFLNRTLDVILDDTNFKLFWDSDNQLTIISVKNGNTTYTPIKQASGMETIFTGLSLIYTISLLNIKHRCSHIFIDELSGQLSTGKNLTFYEGIKNYQELFVKILHKFVDKSIFIVDHNIEYMNENACYEVKYDESGNIYVKK